MAHEFKIKNGLLVSGSVQILGPTTITGSLTLTTGESVTADIFYGTTFSGNANTATTASYALIAQTASFVTTAQTASYVVTALTASYVTSSNVVGTVTSASYALSSSYAATASYVVLAQTASFVANAQTASYVLQAVSSSFATTSSFSTYASNGGNRIYLSGDVTTNVASLSDVTGFTFAARANKTYIIFGFFRVTCTGAGATRFSLNGPSASLVVYGLDGPATTATYINSMATSYNTLLTGVAGSTSATAGGKVNFTATVTTTASGSIAVRFASGTAAQTSVVKSGSWLEWTEQN